MYKIRIPKQFADGGLILLKADESLFRAVMDAIRSPAASGDLGRFAASIIRDRSADLPHISKVIDFFLFIEYQRQDLLSHVNLSVTDFASALADNIEEKSKGSYSIEQSKRFREALTEFFSAKSSLGLSAKANLLLTNNERNFLRVRIISDLRPIFDEDTVNEPIASVISHTLKIEYSEAGARKEFFVALDTSELTELKQAIERAELKTSELRKILKKAEIACVEVTTMD
ncbi:MAG: hypothetical protein K2X93_24070 [Candidatus Obscuribacterales bacterium]|nr:hypothetical protein [Candidatus Obscuribacterales bacterium]